MVETVVLCRVRRQQNEIRTDSHTHRRLQNTLSPLAESECQASPRVPTDACVLDAARWRFRPEFSTSEALFEAQWIHRPSWLHSCQSRCRCPLQFPVLVCVLAFLRTNPTYHPFLLHPFRPLSSFERERVRKCPVPNAKGSEWSSRKATSRRRVQWRLRFFACLLRPEPTHGDAGILARHIPATTNDERLPVQACGRNRPASTALGNSPIGRSSHARYPPMWKNANDNEHPRPLVPHQTKKVRTRTKKLKQTSPTCRAGETPES